MFYSVPLAVVKVLDMMIGEIDYRAMWFDAIISGKIVLPESVITLVMIVVYIFVMPVMVMNLMVSETTPLMLVELFAKIKCMATIFNLQVAILI